MDQSEIEILIQTLEKLEDQFFYNIKNEVYKFEREKLENYFYNNPEQASLNLYIDGTRIKYFKDDKKTVKNCLIAIKQTWEAIQYIPFEKQTEEICIKAFEKNVLSFCYLNPIYITYDMCIEVIREYPDYYIYVPKKYYVTIFFRELFEVEWEIFKTLDKNIVTPEICNIAVLKCYKNIQYVPFEMLSLHLINLALNISIKSLKYIPMSKITYEMIISCLYRDWRTIKYIPNFLTEEFCNIALSFSPLALEYIPFSLKTYKMCLDSVTRNGMMLQYVPYYLQDEFMCSHAVNQNGLAIQFSFIQNDVIKSIALYQNENARMFITV